MSDFNFLPQKFKKKLKDEINSHLLYVATVAVIVWAAVFGISLFAALQFLNIQNAALEENITKISGLKETEEARDLEEEISEFNRLLVRFQEIEKENTYDAVELIRRVSNAVPAGVSLNSLSFHSTTDRIFIDGHANLRTQVIALQNNLEENEAFANVDSPLSNLLKSEDIEFQFTISLSDE